MSKSGIPCTRRVAQAKGLDRHVCQSTLLAQIIQERLVRHQMAAVEHDRVLQEDTKIVVSLLLFRALFCKRRDLYSGACCKFVERFLEIKVLALHHKLEDVSTLTTLAKTAPRTGIGPHHKRRRVLVIVEGTKPRIILALMAKFDPRLRDKVYNIDFGFDLINDRHEQDYRLDWMRWQIYTTPIGRF